MNPSIHGFLEQVNLLKFLSIGNYEQNFADPLKINEFVISIPDDYIIFRIMDEGRSILQNHFLITDSKIEIYLNFDHHE
jgi:hypothetical protein